MAEKRSAQPLTDPVLEYKRELQRLDLLRAQQPIEDGAGTRARLLSAAVSLFARRGFDACTMRDLAAAVGIKAPAIYNHFSSKEEILGEAVEYALADFFGCVLDQLESDPPEHRLQGLVRRHVLYQLERQEIARANDTLLDTIALTRLLPKAKLARLVDGQRAYLHVIRELVRGTLHEDARIDASIAALSIAGMCDRVSSWYKAEGRLSPAEVADEIWLLVQQMLD